jgi:site-specific DNA recombinase
MNDISNKKIRASIYLRVSTEEQAVEGHGLDSQLRKCMAFVESQGFTLLEKHIFRDEGLSGTLPKSQRPGLNNLVESAKRKEFDVIIVYKIDRLSRKLKVTVDIAEELKLINVHIKSVTEPFDTMTAFGMFMLNFLANNAEFEKETIKMRMTDGRTSSAKKGNWVVGMPAYGYVKNEETKKLEIVESEAEVVRMLFNWCVHEKLSLKKIAERINGIGINSPKHVMINKRVTHNFWWERTLGRILTNEIYTGTSYFRKYKRPYKNLTSILEEDSKRPEAEWIEQKVPPIITRELFDKATKQLTLNRTNAERNMQRSYLYSTLLTCGYCGFKMFSGYQPPRKGKHTDKTGRYYHGVYRKKDMVGTTKRCPTCPQYAESRLEPIWETLVDILKNPKNLREPLERYSFKVVDADSINIKQTRNNEKIKDLDSKLRKLAVLFVNNESVELADFKKMESEYSNEKEKLINDNLKLGQSLLTKKDTKNREVVLEELYEKIKDKLDNVSYEDKKYIIHLFIERITLHAKSNYAEVIFKFPTTTVISNTTLDVSQPNMPLFLSVKTYSENEIRSMCIKANPLMGHRAN